MQEVPAAVADVAGEQLVVAHAEDPRGGVVGVDGAPVEVEHEHALRQHLGGDVHAVLQRAQLRAARPQLAAQALGGGDRLHEALAGEVEGPLGSAVPTSAISRRAWAIALGAAFGSRSACSRSGCAIGARSISGFIGSRRPYMTDMARGRARWKPPIRLP